MGNFYRVTKTINGRKYDYWQRTYRVGKSVKTENKYIGPSGRGVSFSPRSSVAPIVAGAAVHAPSTRSPTAPIIPEEAIHQLTPFTAHLKGRDRTAYEKEREKERREDEQIQYGNLADRLRRNKLKLRAAKKLTRHLKPTNYFAAKLALVKKR